MSVLLYKGLSQHTIRPTKRGGWRRG